MTSKLLSENRRGQRHARFDVRQGFSGTVVGQRSISLGKIQEPRSCFSDCCQQLDGSKSVSSFRPFAISKSERPVKSIQGLYGLISGVFEPSVIIVGQRFCRFSHVLPHTNERLEQLPDSKLKVLCFSLCKGHCLYGSKFDRLYSLSQSAGEPRTHRQRIQVHKLTMMLDAQSYLADHEKSSRTSCNYREDIEPLPCACGKVFTWNTEITSHCLKIDAHGHHHGYANTGKQPHSECRIVETHDPLRFPMERKPISSVKGRPY